MQVQSKAACILWRDWGVRVRNISINGLFGRFDYEIPMNLDDRITIIHAPNGFGKTALLRLIAALFGTGDATLLSVPYDELQVDFESGESVSVVKSAQKRESRTGKAGQGLRVVYHDRSKKHDFTLSDGRPEDFGIPVQLIDDIIPELDREGPHLWRNIETGELLNLEEVFDRYGDQLAVARQEHRPEPPEWWKTLRQSVPIRFIQAERLQAAARRSRVRHAKASTSRAVKLYSEELGATIKQTLTEYAALSQSLDRTFPARVVTHGSPLSTERLQGALKEIEKKRARLVEAGLLEQEGEDTTVPALQQIDPANLPVLSVYVQDTHKKLGVFDLLVAKVELFKRSINDRFLYKQISIGKEGFTFTTAEEDQLDPVKLSSGEQHEIVLLYQLLFQAAENSLFLLDEPEISLHVAWQEQFLPGLQAITALSGFDALIATHSPQIIGDRWDLTVELKGPLHEVRSHANSLSK
jgi:predicted ATP-binding protein involved in virulence